MDKLRICLLAVFIACYGFAVSPAQLYAQDKIVAIVNSDVITQKDLSDFVNFTRMQLSGQYQGKELEEKTRALKSDLLNKLIDDRIILQEAKRSKVKADEEKIKEKVNEIKRRYSSETDFQQALALQGLVQADIEKRLNEQMLMYNIIEMRVKSKIAVNPAEVTDFYQRNPQEFNLSEQRDFESAVFEDADAASQVAANLKKGQTLGALAQKYSFNVGTLGGVVEAELRKELSDALFKIKIGEYAGPLKIENKYYIFRLNKISPPRAKQLSEVQERIYSFLLEKKLQESLAKWLDELKGRAYIKIIQG
jgi:parvulin-like peptidyl-prolyl isomerase